MHDDIRKLALQRLSPLVPELPGIALPRTVLQLEGQRVLGRCIGRAWLAGAPGKEDGLAINTRPEIARQNSCNCSDFTTHSWAQWFHDTYDPGDVNRLDSNHDGVVCESLPG